MIQPDENPNDQVGPANYRVDAGFVCGYALLYAGLLFLSWDPRYVFLGVAIEIALANVGLIVRAFMTARGPVAMTVATLLCLPALLIALVFAAMPAYRIATDGDFDASPIGWLLLAGFFLSTLYSEWQRFRKTTLPQARFTRYFDEKYVHEDGSPVFNGVSHVFSSVVASWLLTGVFVVSWLVATGVGAIQKGDGELMHFTNKAALVLVTLCLLRQLVTINIVRIAFRNRSNQEDLWLKTYSQQKKIVLRDHRS